MNRWRTKHLGYKLLKFFGFFNVRTGICGLQTFRINKGRPDRSILNCVIDLLLDSASHDIVMLMTLELKKSFTDLLPTPTSHLKGSVRLAFGLWVS